MKGREGRKVTWTWRLGLFIDGRNLEDGVGAVLSPAFTSKRRRIEPHWRLKYLPPRAWTAMVAHEKRRWSFVHVAGLGRFSVSGVNGRNVDMMGANLSSIYGDWTFCPFG